MSGRGPSSESQSHKPLCSGDLGVGSKTLTMLRKTCWPFLPTLALERIRFAPGAQGGGRQGSVGVGGCGSVAVSASADGETWVSACRTVACCAGPP